MGFELRKTYPPVEHPSSQTDNYTYQSYALQIANGEYDYDKGFYYQPFYYSVFLPLTYKAFGPGTHGVILVQSLLGAASVFLIGLAFAALFGRRTGIFAAVFLALCRFHIFYTPFTLIAVLQSFWISLIVLLVIWAYRRKNWWLWSIAALVLGLANVTRGNIILLAPLAIALLIWQQRRQHRKLVLNLVLCAICWYLPQLPFAIVNYRATGAWVGPSTAGANVLALGNTPESPPGGREPYDAGAMAYPESCGAWVAADKADGDSRVSIHRSMLNWFRREPLAYVELKARMFILFWNRMEVPNNISILTRGQPIPGRLIHLPFLLDFWLLGSLGVAGLLFALIRSRRSPSVLLAVGCTLVYSLSIVLFYVLARFRVPILPLVCGFAAYTVMLLWRQRKELLRPRRPLLIHGGILVASILFVVIGYDAYRFGWESTVMRVARPNGVQVELPGKRLIKDHGPFQFGGWVPEPGSSEIDKYFAGVPGLEKATRIELRLAVNTTRPARVILESMGVRKEYSPKPGLDWLAIDLPREQVVVNSQGDQVHLPLRITVTDPEA
ncbi:hypothetical protein BVY04_03200, partial [bacterium M21]